ncbi:MAG TPA: peptidylprolyl isomerase [Thermoanaerobaculia bacterium]|nr:peptidylprolyl isomerase [Thermoanaerobaculia bacterium]
MILFLLLASLAASGDVTPEAATPRVALTTNHGTVVLELYSSRAPQTVESFLAYVDSGFYDGTVFHRVIPGFMIQGGGFTPDLQQKSTRPPVANEADNGLRNERGTVAMARTMEPHSATAQFFVNLADNAFLDHTGKNPRGWGYAVFGRVVEGMEVVEAIAGVRTADRGSYQNVPAEPVVIETARRID